MLRRVVLPLKLCLLLAIFPALAVAQTGSTMNYPRLFAPAEHASTGIAIVNPNATSASVTLRYYSADGELLSFSTVTVPGSGQLAQLVSQIFPSVTQRGWISATSTMPNLESFWLTGDFSTSTDSAASSPVSSVVLYPIVTDRTELSIANVGTTGETVTFLVFDQIGNPIGVSDRPIAARGIVQGTVAQLTGTAVTAASTIYVAAVGSSLSSRLA